MKRVSFREELCKGCKLCVQACPKNIISLSENINSMGYRHAMITSQDKCSSCAFCAWVCPDLVITVKKD